MLSARPIGVRHPKLTLAAAVVVLAVLAVLGIGIERRLEPASLTVPGTESSRADELLREHFGDSAPFAILLEGPPAAIEAQGPRLIAVLRRDPEVSTISPWDRGVGLESLRPQRRRALIMVDYRVSAATAMETTAPHLDRIVAATISPPLQARTAGFASLARAIRDSSVEVTRRGETILAPILLLVLLFVFRSPVAAVIPVAFGATTVIAARGLISLIANFVEISGFALSIATMIGLALGVDYALLIVSRFREELERGAEPARAAAITRATAGRTTVFAGGILLGAVLISATLVPGALLLSLCATVAPAIVVAVVGPWVVAPAILVLLGHRIDRWRIGRRGPARTRWLTISRAALRHPAATAAAVGLLVLVVAFPTTSLATGSVTIEQLPPGDPTRQNVEAIEAAVGAGWISPSVVVAVSSDGPITTPRKLNRLQRWQAEVAGDKGVAAVIGPGPLVERVAPLQRLSSRFVDGGEGSEGSAAVADLSRAGAALGRLRRGLGLATDGARALALGSERAEAGAGALADGLSLATGGGDRARQALDRFRRGAHLLADGEQRLALGLSVLDFSVAELHSELAHAALPGAQRLGRLLEDAAAGAPAAEAAAATTLERLQAAWRELEAMSVGKGDPRYPALEAAVREALTAAGGRDPAGGASYAADEDLPAAVAGLGHGLREGSAAAERLQAQLSEALAAVASLRRLVDRLERGAARLREGSGQLAGGSDRIVRGATRLSTGLERLAGGAARLGDGLGRLSDGNARLERGLAFAFHRSRPLVTGAREAEARIVSARQRLQRNSPRIFDSGYFVLSALDGAPAAPRELAGQAIDLRGGGQAAKMLVIGDHGGTDDPNATGIYDGLRADAGRLAGETGMEVAVTGGIAQSTDYERATGDRLPLLIVTITFVTFLAMLAILRALPLALLAISVNLLVVAAAFGVLELLTRLPDQLPFGGASHLDPVAAAGIFGVVFGLSIDYCVFLLMRMREAWVRDGDNDAAVAYGLERTASVITGAATIMAIVFLVLATAPIQSVAQFGVSLTVVVMLDATAVRLMLLPALIKLIGPRVWWLPGWLDRLLPRLDVHGEGPDGVDWKPLPAGAKIP